MEKKGALEIQNSLINEHVPPVISLYGTLVISAGDRRTHFISATNYDKTKVQKNLLYIYIFRADIRILFSWLGELKMT